MPDPFSDEPGARLYRTGDRGGCCPTATSSSSGALDHQVKLRGFRIELGEIEACCAGTRRSATRWRLVRQAGGDAPPRRVRRGRRAIAPMRAACATFVRERLPDHMVPATFVFARHAAADAQRQARSARPAVAGADRRPRRARLSSPHAAPTEDALAAIWPRCSRSTGSGIHGQFLRSRGPLAAGRPGDRARAQDPACRAAAAEPVPEPTVAGPDLEVESARASGASARPPPTRRFGSRATSLLARRPRTDPMPRSSSLARRVESPGSRGGTRARDLLRARHRRRVRHAAAPAGHRVSVDGDQIRCSAPSGVLTDALRRELTTRKAEVLAWLRSDEGGHRCRSPSSGSGFSTSSSPAIRSTPWPPRALPGPSIVAALERALTEIVRRHEVLRTTFVDADGRPVRSWRCRRGRRCR